MVEQKICQGCSQRNKCEEVYERLGRFEGPSVAWKVTVAFLLPMAVFIGSLVVLEGVLGEVVGSHAAQTTVGFALALCSSFVCILVTRVINRQFGKGR